MEFINSYSLDHEELCEVDLVWNHNHNLLEHTNLHYKLPSEKTRQYIDQLMEAGVTSASLAKDMVTEKLIEDPLPDYIKTADNSKNPNYQYVRR